MGKGIVHVSLPLVQTAIFKNAVKVISAELKENGEIAFVIESEALPKSNEAPLLNMLCQEITLTDYIIEGFEDAS
jgi:hypothetical protein